LAGIREEAPVLALHRSSAFSSALVPDESETRRFSLALGLAGALVVILVGPVRGQTQVNRKHTETLLAPFPPEAYGSVMVSPDGRRIAYVLKANGGEKALVDGKEEKLYQQVASLTFSPDGKTLAYADTRHGRSCAR
jgi:hypothetical protein